MGRGWKAWRATIIAIVTVIVIGSLASASPSLRPPRRASEPLSTGTTAVTGTTGSGIEPAGSDVTDPSESASGAPDLGACEGMTGLDNAICRQEALLVAHPNNQGLQNSLRHLQENRQKREGSGGRDGHAAVPPGGGSSSSSSSSSAHGHSGESHGNVGGNANGNAGGNGH